MFENSSGRLFLFKTQEEEEEADQEEEEEEGGCTEGFSNTLQVFFRNYRFTF